MRVLVATDGSPAAGLAVDLVAGIDWPPGTSVRVVEAVDTARAVLDGPGAVPAAGKVDKTGADLSLGPVTVVEAVRARLARPGLDVSVEILRGRPPTAIVDASKDWHADLIVIGSRGHGTIQSMVLGSVSAEVVDHAVVPVLVARGRSVAGVVLAWDGSSCGRVAAGLLTAWPIFARSSIRVVSVTGVGVQWWVGFPTPGTSEAVSLYLDATKAARETHAELAKNMATELRAAGLDAVAEARDGDPATELIAAARDASADLIVLGTHGRTGLARLVLGSVARNVLHHVACSVLIAREQPSED